LRNTTETAVGCFILAAIAIFIYLGVYIGTWRYDGQSYASYDLFFRDVSGLVAQAPVQIAGVKVGWVDDVSLAEDISYAHVAIKIGKAYTLHEDAYGVIRQDGMLGGKFIELHPGDPQRPVLAQGSAIHHDKQDSSDLDEVTQQVSHVVSSVCEMTDRINDVFLHYPEYQHENTLHALQTTASSMASFVQQLDNIVSHNQASLKQTLDRVHAVTGTLQEDIPQLMHQAHSSLEQLSRTLDEDMQRITDNMAQTSESLERVMYKIDQGEGVLGQLVTNPTLSDDLQAAMEGARSYFDAMHRLSLIVDGHTEAMTHCGALSCVENAKGHVNLRLHFFDDYFYLLGIAAVQGNGDAYVKDEETIHTYFDKNRNILRPEELDLDDRSRLQFAPFRRKVERKFDHVLYNIQVGRIYDWLTLRIGLFENAFGCAVDTETYLDAACRYHWISSLEAYDWNGRNRVTGHHYENCQGERRDTRPHLKWINKVFITPNMYITFGADDFISRTNKTAFVGGGLCFSDDYLKYFLSQIGS